MNKGLILIIIGAIFECGWVYGLKYANSPYSWGFTAVSLSISTIVFMNAFKFLKPSLAYVLYVGLGTAFVVSSEIITNFTHGIEINYWRIFFVITLIIGVLGLRGGKI